MNGRAHASIHLLVGLFIVAIGVLLILDNLDIVNTGGLWRLWPLVFFGLGARVLAGTEGRMRWVGAGIWFFVGAVFLARALGYTRFGFSELWPVFLVLLGLSMMLRSGSRHSGGSAVDMDSQCRAFALMGGIERKNASKDFRSAELTAIMGGVELDLSQAVMTGDQAVIDTFAFWGGVEVKVPPDWTVVSKVLPIMGGYEDKTHPPAAAGKTLVLQGTAIMGGVGVKN